MQTDDGFEAVRRAAARKQNAALSMEAKHGIAMRVAHGRVYGWMPR